MIGKQQLLRCAFPHQIFSRVKMFISIILCRVQANCTGSAADSSTSSTSSTTADDFDEDEKKIDIEKEAEQIKEYTPSDAERLRFYKYQVRMRQKCNDIVDRHKLKGPATV